MKPQALSGRRHDLDALRVIAFGLLILYHASGIWQTDSDFHVVSRHTFDQMDGFRILLNRWRMPLLFAISGIAIGLAAPRDGWLFVRQRTSRLLIPLAFGMLTMMVVQAYCEARLNGQVPAGFLGFWWRYLQLRPWPADTFTGASHGVTWNHLWYLPYLWCYTLLLMMLRPVLQNSRESRLGALSKPLGVVVGWLLPVLAWLIALLWLKPRFPESHAFIGDWYAHVVYFGCFLAGWWVSREQGAWEWLARWRWLTVGIAAIAIMIELLLKFADLWLDEAPLPDWASAVNWGLVETTARATYGWTAMLAIFGFGVSHLNKPFRWLPYASEAVYPWYILHQTLLVLIGYWVIPLGWNAAMEVVAILGGTIVGCLLLHELLIRRIALLRPLFGLKPAADAQRSVAPLPRPASHPAPTDRRCANAAPVDPLPIHRNASR